MLVFDDMHRQWLSTAYVIGKEAKVVKGGVHTAAKMIVVPIPSKEVAAPAACARGSSAKPESVLPVQSANYKRQLWQQRVLVQVLLRHADHAVAGHECILDPPLKGLPRSRVRTIIVQQAPPPQNAKANGAARRYEVYHAWSARKALTLHCLHPVASRGSHRLHCPAKLVGM